MEDKECRLQTEPHCEDVSSEECRDVPTVKLENQCTTIEEEKCINTTVHKMVTQEKTLVELSKIRKGHRASCGTPHSATSSPTQATIGSSGSFGQR